MKTNLSSSNVTILFNCELCEVTLKILYVILKQCNNAFRLPIRLTVTFYMSKQIFAHYADIVRDVYFLVLIGQLVEGGAFFLEWVSTLLSFVCS